RRGIPDNHFVNHHSLSGQNNATTPSEKIKSIFFDLISAIPKNRGYHGLGSVYGGIGSIHGASASAPG
ncbi:MAG: hypothetical protein ABIR47_06725, partial [Candidatus Kapaibacterium sp.]